MSEQHALKSIHLRKCRMDGGTCGLGGYCGLCSHAPTSKSDPEVIEALATRDVEEAFEKARTLLSRLGE